MSTPAPGHPRTGTPPDPAPPTLETTLGSAGQALDDVADSPLETRARALHTWWLSHRSREERAGNPVLPFATLVLVAPEDVFARAFQLHFDAATGRTAPR